MNFSAPRISARPASRVAGVSACLVGVAVLIGWALDIVFLKSIIPGWPAMQANTAVCFLLAGAAILFLKDEDATPRNQWLGQGLALAVLVTALIAPIPPARAGLSATVSLVMFGGSLLLLDIQKAGGLPAQLCAIITIAISLTSVFGYLSGR